MKSHLPRREHLIKKKIKTQEYILLMQKQIIQAEAELNEINRTLDKYRLSNNQLALLEHAESLTSQHGDFEIWFDGKLVQECRSKNIREACIKFAWRIADCIIEPNFECNTKEMSLQPHLVKFIIKE